MLPVLASKPIRLRGLKWDLCPLLFRLLGSKPIRLRGLKFEAVEGRPVEDESKPIRLRGLKFLISMSNLPQYRRSLYGFVD